MTGKWEILIKCKTVSATCKNLELWTELSCFSVPSLRCLSWPCVVHFQLRARYAPATSHPFSSLFPSKGQMQWDLDDCRARTSSALFPELGRYEPQEMLQSPWETYRAVILQWRQWWSHGLLIRRGRQEMVPQPLGTCYPNRSPGVLGGDQHAQQGLAVGWETSARPFLTMWTHSSVMSSAHPVTC